MTFSLPFPSSLLKLPNISMRKHKSQPVLDDSFLEGLNNFFGDLCCNSEYIERAMVHIDPGSATTPTLDEYQVILALSKIKKSAAGPDGIPHWVWKDNAQQLEPVITAVWNLSLRRHTWPLAWKEANINPLPKLDTPIEYQDFRGINVTPIIARCFERTVYQAFSKPVFVANLHPTQFAYRDGCSFTDALIRMQYNCLKPLDDPDTVAVRLFAMDFSKAFDNVDHFPLSEKLKALNMNPYLTNWYLSFLKGRKQRLVFRGKHLIGLLLIRVPVRAVSVGRIYLTFL